MNFHYVTDMLDVVKLALMPNKVKNALDITYRDDKKAETVV